MQAGAWLCLLETSDESFCVLFFGGAATALACAESCCCSCYRYHICIVIRRLYQTGRIVQMTSSRLRVMSMFVSLDPIWKPANFQSRLPCVARSASRSPHSIHTRPVQCLGNSNVSCADHILYCDHCLTCLVIRPRLSGPAG